MDYEGDENAIDDGVASDEDYGALTPKGMPPLRHVKASPQAPEPPGRKNNPKHTRIVAKSRPVVLWEAWLPARPVPLLASYQPTLLWL